MTALTSTYRLPYQVPGDRPCDMAGVWCQLRDLVAAEMAVSEAILGRTWPARPAAIMSLRTPTTLPALNSAGSMFPVVFDTIDFDNDGMCDFDVSRQFIRPTRPGIYMVVGWASLGTGTFNEEVEMSIMTCPSGANLLNPSGGHSCGIGLDANLVGGTPMWYKAEATDWLDAQDIANTQVYGYGLLFDGGTNSTVALNAARVAVYWQGDAP